MTPRHYLCPRATTPVRVDGRLDEKAWANASWTDDFVDIEGVKRPKPRLRTRAKMMWDDRYLYVGAELEEPHVWGTLYKHDSVIFYDNDFEVFIDPDGDNHEYFEIEINALNTEWDLFLKRPYRDGGPAEDGWEIPGLMTATSVKGTLNDPTDRDEFWSVEMAIPWEALARQAHRRTPPGDGDQWRLNFSRVEWQATHDRTSYTKVPKRPEDNWVWSPQGVVDMHRPERWGYVQFTHAPAGLATKADDPSSHARDALMAIYQAEKAFKTRMGRYSASLAELNGAGAHLERNGGISEPEIRVDGDHFRASVLTGTGEVWVVGEDSRLRREAGAR